MTQEWKTLDRFAVPSEPGGERDVVRRLSTALQNVPLTPNERDRLSTAVAETVMNAMEHGNGNDLNLLVEVWVRTDDATVEVLVSDNGGLRALPDQPEVPDLDAKLLGLQRPRGWGLFLIRSMVDEMDVVADPDDSSKHTARLRVNISAASLHAPEEPRHAQQL